MKIKVAVLFVMSAVLLTLPLQAQTSISMTCSSPTNGGSYTSPMPVQCTATAVGDKVDSGWHIYVDQGAQDIKVTAPIASTSSINTSVQLSNGQHSITIRAWQAAGSQFATVTATVSIGGTAPPPPPPPPNPTSTTGGHVVIVMEENHSYAATVNPNNMPYLYSLSQKYSNATQYYAETHPSLGNYFELTVGWKITDDDSPAVYDVDNITKYLQAAGKSWKVYAENLPNVGYVGPDSGAYLRGHNPFAYFANVVNSNLKNNIVPFSQFAQDLANGQLPNYSFIIPNNCDNSHDCSLNTADSWLKQNLDPLFSDTQTFGVDGLLMVVMDESDGSDGQYGGGHTAAVLAGPRARQGVQSPVLYKPASVLRTTCDVLGLNGCPGRAQSTIGFNDMIK